MRITLDLDCDVLVSVNELARRQERTAGEVVSELARLGLAHQHADRGAGPEPFLGFVPIAPRGTVATNDDVNRLRAEVGD